LAFAVTVVLRVFTKPEVDCGRRDGFPQAVPPAFPARFPQPQEPSYKLKLLS